MSGILWPVKRGWPLSTAVVLFGVILSASIPPARYACGVPHPIAGSNVLIGPGDVCITANGLGTVLERVTYEELRGSAIQRRIGTIMVIGLIVVITLIAVRRYRSGVSR
jgi:hypothetical protein